MRRDTQTPITELTLWSTQGYRGTPPKAKENETKHTNSDNHTDTLVDAGRHMEMVALETVIGTACDAVLTVVGVDYHPGC